MKIKSLLAKPYAAIVHKTIQRNAVNALKDQESIFNQLIQVGKKTIFGNDHHFDQIKSYEDFQNKVPLVDYETIKPYIDKIIQGQQNVLWKGKPIYFAKTSGTTSGVKYIPITKDSIPNHINSAKNALLCYMVESGKTDFADGKMIFLSGSPALERKGFIPTGRLSGIANHYVPNYLRTNQLPKYETNCIEDWEVKLGKIVEETIDQNMTLISGIPPWVQMYFDWLQEKSGGKSIRELFPNLQVIVHGGVNFEPYKQKLFNSLGGPIDTIETYPASEGFFAFQDTLTQDGLLLNTNSGIFFEFVPVNEIHNDNPTRLRLHDIEVGVNYALVINSNAGLWGYVIGDTVKFVSTKPYRIKVTGRIKHYISAFGEHVIAEEVDEAISKAADYFKLNLTEYTVAPQINPASGLPHHEWFIAFDQLPSDLSSIEKYVDDLMREQNIYYDDLITGQILQPLKITALKADAFQLYMKSLGKLGGQNKVPRLANDRQIADGLQPYKW